ncbi:hypothetical protein PSH96_16990 [Pseudomonas sp. FP2338]|nr:hypothetical protein [Pseudomonas sp. FP2338]WLH82536.1 hypothetical protein PSH96_16990 [Pseudomonas sp. FP2338]
MRNRGQVYWEWVNTAIHTRSVDERLVDGTFLNVQVRMSLLGRTQLFIGVYAAKGMMLYEEAFDSTPAETMTKALAWGLEQARIKAPALSLTSKSAESAPLPRPGSRQGE